MKLKVKLKADNSSGEQELYMQYDKRYNEFWMGICGNLDGEYFQVDFNSLTPKEFERIYKSIKLIRKNYKKQNN